MTPEMSSQLIYSPRCPLLLFCSTWFEQNRVAGEFNDLFRHLVNKLIFHAQSDPLAGGNALVAIYSNGEYRSSSFPGLIKYQGFRVHSVALELLVRQTEWQLLWDQDQLLEICTLQPAHEDARDFVQFWVASEHEEVEVAFQARLSLLQWLLDSDAFTPSTLPNLGLDALYTIIDSGAQVTALLTECDYYGQGPPWLRHRFRKLTLVRNYMLHIIKCVLQLWRPYLVNPSTLNGVSEYALQYNARVFNTWKTALKEAGMDFPSKYLDHEWLETGVDSWIPEERKHRGTHDEQKKKTECCDGSEEEWEEEYRPNTAVKISLRDERNTQNPQTRDCRQCELFARRP